jgi:hypothetical protein
MPTTNPTQNEALGDLQRLSAALTANAGDFENILGALTEFQTLVGQMQDAATQQALLTSAKQVATKRFQDLLRIGRAQGVLLRNAARVRYGRGSDKLAQFGVQPFRGRKITLAETPTPDPDPETPPTIE